MKEGPHPVPIQPVGAPSPMDGQQVVVAPSPIHSHVRAVLEMMERMHLAAADAKSHRLHRTARYLEWTMSDT